MDQQTRQQALDDITPEELAKVKSHQAKTDGAFKVDEEWLILAEFAKAFGWQAYLDAKEDKIRADEMMTLIEANRILEYKNLYDAMQASFVGAISAQSKKPGNTFAKLTKNVLKKIRVSK